MSFDVENEFLESIRCLGGKRPVELMQFQPGTNNADFIFANQKVVAELKSLDEDKINDERVIEKVSALYLSELENGHAPVVVFGEARMTTAGFNPEYVEGIKDIYKTPVRNAVKKANQQIRDTKKVLGDEAYKGLLIVANNNHSALDPWHAHFILCEILRKEEFRSINTAIYFTANQEVFNPEAGEETSVWIVFNRSFTEKIPEQFCNDLRSAWFSHLTKMKGERGYQETQSDQHLLLRLENVKNTE